MPVWEYLNATQSLDYIPYDKIRTGPMLALFERMYTQVGQVFALEGYQQFKDLHQPLLLKREHDKPLPPKDYWHQLFRQYALAVSSQKVAGITLTTRNFIRKVIAMAGKEGWSIPRTVKEMRKRWRALTRRRATTIARTEILGIQNYAQLTGTQSIAQSLGVTLNKVWLSNRADTRTREAHRQAFKQTVAIDQPFVVMGQQLMHPGDTSLGATAANIINCRCTHYYEPIE